MKLSELTNKQVRSIQRALAAVFLALFLISLAMISPKVAGVIFILLFVAGYTYWGSMLFDKRND